MKVCVGGLTDCHPLALKVRWGPPCSSVVSPTLWSRLILHYPFGRQARLPPSDGWHPTTSFVFDIMLLGFMHLEQEDGVCVCVCDSCDVCVYSPKNSSKDLRLWHPSFLLSNWMIRLVIPKTSVVRKMI